MRADAVARKIAEIFEETDAVELSEVTVGVTDAKSISAALKRLGFEVRSQTKATGYALTVSRSTSRRTKADRADEKRG